MPSSIKKYHISSHILTSTTNLSTTFDPIPLLSSDFTLIFQFHTPMAGTPSFKASQLDIYSLSTSDSPSKATAPMQHRLDLIAFWGIQPGSRVLEIGCGQGDCTVVLAEAVGEGGHVDAVDPGAPDYGLYFSSLSREP